MRLVIVRSATLTFISTRVTLPRRIEGVTSSINMESQEVKKKKKKRQANKPLMIGSNNIALEHDDKSMNKTNCISTQSIHEDEVTDCHLPIGDSNQRTSEKRQESNGSEEGNINKKKKNNVTSSIDDTRPGQQGKDGEAEDVAESIDSGCVVDSPPDIMRGTGTTDWPQVETVLLEESKFISSLFGWVPVYKEVQVDPIQELTEREEREEMELKLLQSKYENMLADFRKMRNINVNADLKKKEKRLKQEMKGIKKKKEKRLSHSRQLKKHLMKRKKTMEDMEPENGRQKKKQRKTPIYNSEGELVFSKFDFSSNVREENPSRKSKNLKQLLSKALKEKEKMKQLEEKGMPETAAELAEHRSWAAAMNKAEGIKIQDDMIKLKKSIKNRDQKKKNSKKKWEEQHQKVEKKKQDKQEVRKKNIAARTEAKMNKNKKKGKKRGHVVPGF
ncbi:hypothetical protein Pcinc_005353 [Petrolisthes cinctipes]|uniref:Ribosomal RNA-processing protein 14/surfeit locus protein 6 C-terminal domain-containing protein n=1 Tax=Petrolisthes cinctipes TaxID=88211 RepID=A0AAE1GJK4_PETCI|nr:hypothetical protein Pcinc_005353 [Petrolisthes cinctipes]